MPAARKAALDVTHRQALIGVLILALLAEASALILQPSTNFNMNSKNLPSLRRAGARCAGPLQVQARLDAGRELGEIK